VIGIGESDDGSYDSPAPRELGRVGLARVDKVARFPLSFELFILEERIARDRLFFTVLVFVSAACTARFILCRTSWLCRVLGASSTIRDDLNSRFRLPP
jgi:hypothetical protein